MPLHLHEVVVVRLVQTAEGVYGEVGPSERVHVRAQASLHHVEKRVANREPGAAAQHGMLEYVRHARAVHRLRGETAREEVV